MKDSALQYEKINSASDTNVTKLRESTYNTLQQKRCEAFLIKKLACIPISEANIKYTFKHVEDDFVPTDLFYKSLNSNKGCMTHSEPTAAPLLMSVMKRT